MKIYPYDTKLSAQQGDLRIMISTACSVPGLNLEIVAGPFLSIQYDVRGNGNITFCLFLDSLGSISCSYPSPFRPEDFTSLQPGLAHAFYELGHRAGCVGNVLFDPCDR